MSLTQILETEYLRAKRIIQFGRQLYSRSSGTLHPRMHQLVRIFESTQNGHKRILCADTTSAGKTFTATAIKSVMDLNLAATSTKKTKALVVAPDQALGSAWLESEINTYMKSLGMPPQRVLRLNANNTDQLSTADIILVNYDKFSIPQERNRYFLPIINFMPHIDLVLVDECHNLRNIASNRSIAFTQIIQQSIGKNFVMLSASPIPNRLTDAGFLLYMLDPIKYKYYGTNVFDYESDMFSIANMMNSGNVFTFSRDDLKVLFNLPELRFEAPELGLAFPHIYDLEDNYKQAYFKKWATEDNTGKKIADLSGVLLDAAQDQTIEVSRRIFGKYPNAQIGIFSFHVDGFANDIATKLEKTFGKKTEIINGTVDPNERQDRARRFREGQTSMLVNSFSTVSESISLITYDRPSFLLFAEPTAVPATFDQTIGRFYRVNQSAPVTAIEMIPQSPSLNALMETEKEELSHRGVRFRATWKPATLFENKRDLRYDKDEVIISAKTGKSIEGLSQVADVDDSTESQEAFTSLPVKAEACANVTFNEGLKKVRQHIGKGIEGLLASPEINALVESYSSADWGLTSSADTNNAIAQAIIAIEKSRGEKCDFVLDWGCGTACLARTLKRKIYNLDASKQMLENGKLVTKDIYAEDTDEYFTQAFAQNMPYPNEFFHLVSSSYAIQYNAQGYQHKRDIEKILAQTNRVLKTGWYGIFGLPNQATTQDDFKMFTENLLPKYGNRVLVADFITGHANSAESGREKKVFGGFYFILYQKERSVQDLVGEDDSTFVFSPYKRIGIGGWRAIDTSRSTAKPYKRELLPASEFRGTDKSRLADTIEKAMRGD